jgi:hypothetical protein
MRKLKNGPSMKGTSFFAAALAAGAAGVVGVVGTKGCCPSPDSLLGDLQLGDASATGRVVAGVHVTVGANLTCLGATAFWIVNIRFSSGKFFLKSVCRSSAFRTTPDRVSIRKSAGNP